MPCYRPIEAYRSREGRNKNGRWPIVFNVTAGWKDFPITVPCGQCIGCRLDRSRQWAIRCVHEAQLHEDNSFITLTYDDDHLPEGNTLVKKDYVDFMKRLRKRYEDDHKIRFFHCGEYGENFQRPHHHACLFGHDFEDKRLLRVKGGVRLYTSEILRELWPFGYNTIGEVTFDSAAYVARYITKKVTGEGAEEYYGDREPEYITMSRRPGIGNDWFSKYKNDILESDRVFVKPGVLARPARFYDKIYERMDKDAFEVLKSRRKKLASENTDNSRERLEVKERLQNLKFKQIKRSYEHA